MKKTMTKIFALVLVLAMVVGFIAMIPAQATAIEETPNVEIVANNVIFDEKLHMMYAIKASGIEAEDIAIKLYNEANKSLGTATYIGEEDVKGEQCFVFTAQEGIAVQDIAENVYAKVEVNGTEVAVGRRSVLEYLYSQLLTKEDIKAEQKAMYESLLSYAGALQTLLTTQTNPVECKDINNYSFVKVVNGTVDGTYAAGMIEVGTTLSKIACNQVAGDGQKVVWTVTKSGAATGTFKMTTEEVQAITVEKGVHLIISAEVVDETPAFETAEATITFDNVSKRESYSTSAQVWKENGITVTNAKGSSTTNIYDYASGSDKFIRTYKNSTVTIAGHQMTQIVIEVESDYGTGFDAQPGVVRDGTTITITLDEVTDSVTYTMGAQTRITSITVTYKACEEHVEKTVDKAATCTEDGYTGRVICEVCGTVIEEGTVVTATGHNYNEVVTAPTCTAKGYTTYTCACGDTYKDNEVEALDHIDENDDKLCDRDGCDYQFPGDDEPATPTTKTITFTMGADGSATHKDGSTDKSSYSETVDGYTLSLTGGSKMYPTSIDAMGNGCIKFGSSSAAGKFTLTVGENVTKVIIYVAGYKANSAKIQINGGTAQTISTQSNSGSYTAIEIDTSTNKTITFATASGGYRAMVNTIEFVVEE